MPNIVRLIEYFNCNIITENTFDKDKWIKLNEKAMKVGYWIHPNAANQYTKAFLKTKIVDYNSTFYKTRYKEDISFNAETGELQVNGKTNLPFNKEYWMPENESGTPQIETLVDSGPSINDSEQLKYFLSKLYKMSKIPENRFDKEAQSTWFGSDATQQLRDEINFSRFVTRLRNNFAQIFNDVISKTRIELLCDQLLHYITTYGTHFNYGNGYVPNDGNINIESTFKNYKVIIGCTINEMLEKCASLVYSGIALHPMTMKTVMGFIIETNQNFINVDNIKNREALVYFCSHTGILPNDPISLFRYIIYKVTGETVIIKNDRLIELISVNSTKFDFSELGESQMIGLASIFNRFKTLFLAFKKYNNCCAQNYPEKLIINNKNKSCINKLRKNV